MTDSQPRDKHDSLTGQIWNDNKKQIQDLQKKI